MKGFCSVLLAVAGIAGSAYSARFDEGRMLVEVGPSKALKVEDNIRWLEEGKVPAYAVANVIKWLSLHGADVAKFRERYRPVEPGLGEPLAKRPGFRLGYMLDISRDKVPTLDTLKAIANTLAALGYDAFQLYTECAFAYADLEPAWREWSPMTPAETRELADHCKSKGLLLLPNQNSFGHLERLFQHPQYRCLAETPNGYNIEHPPLKNRPPCALCPTDPKTYAFLDSLYAQLLPNFPGATVINVGCDEVWDIFDKTGRSAAKAAEKGVSRVYMDHMLDVHRLLAKRGFQMAFWADMVLYDPTLLDEVPKDAIPLQWGYSSEQRTKGYTCEFEGRCLALQRRGLDYHVCPSTCTFGTAFGNGVAMRGNVSLAVAAARRYDAKGLLMTTWGDGGHRAPFLAELPGLVYAAAQVRGEDPSEAEVAEKVEHAAKGVPGCKEVGLATRDLLAEIDAARKDGTLAVKRGAFATRYSELWLRHNRVGGLLHSLQCLGLTP
ncbi:MAG: family 20 glycosylhydrolase [Kiritimatiellae bacterium]|nr:family 20 glycosylhydrolase [Kiritimatiellia bacterium]